MDSTTIKDKVENRLVAKQTLISVGTVILGLLVSALAATGLKFDASQLVEAAYYIRAAINYIVMMATYSIIRQTTIASEKRAPNTPYAQVVATYWGYLTYLIKSATTESLRPKVAAENKRRREETMDLMLSRVSIDLRHTDILTFDSSEAFTSWIDRYAEANLYSKRRKKALRKTCERIRSGDFRYSDFTLEDLVNDNEFREERMSSNSMRLETTKFEARQTARKTMMFLVNVIIINSLVFSGFSTSFWAFLMTNGFLIGSACVSAMQAGKAYISYRREIVQNRNVFLSNNLGGSIDGRD